MKSVNIENFILKDGSDINIKQSHELKLIEKNQKPSLRPENEPEALADRLMRQGDMSKKKRAI